MAGKIAMYKIYILKSKIKNHFYVGHTNNLEKRLNSHNRGRVKSTKSCKPWKIIYTENFGNKHDAFKREKQIKSYKGGEAFKKLINNFQNRAEGCLSG